MTPQELRNSILQLAVQGRLVEQRGEEGTGEELYRQIQKEKARLVREAKIKKGKTLPEIPEEEVPFDIPESWKWVRLGSVISLLSGSDLASNKYNSRGNGIPYITGASNIENGILEINRWTEYPKNIATRGDLLLTCKGTVGKTTILEEDKVHIARQLMSITPIVVDTTFIRESLI
jgi:type I restriction enzyme S subunit